MPGYFFDSSALVKIYHREIGTLSVDQIAQAGGNQILMARLTVAEVTSAFAIKVRTQAISRDDADSFLRQFRGDIALGKLAVFSVTEAEFIRTEWLIGAMRLSSGCEPGTPRSWP